MNEMNNKTIEEIRKEIKILEQEIKKEEFKTKVFSGIVICFTFITIIIILLQFKEGNVKYEMDTRTIYENDDKECSKKGY